MVWDLEDKKETMSFEHLEYILGGKTFKKNHKHFLNVWSRIQSQKHMLNAQDMPAGVFYTIGNIWYIYFLQLKKYIYYNPMVV